MSYTSMNYNRDNFNRILGRKIIRKLITTATIIAGLSILDKAL